MIITLYIYISLFSLSLSLSVCLSLFLSLLDTTSISYAAYVEHISKLPFLATPEVYGLHANADITKDNKESRDMLGSILLTQGASKSSGIHLYHSLIIYIFVYSSF